MIYKTLLFGLLISVNIYSQVAIYDSGGPLHPDMSVYDIKHYVLDIEIFPNQKAIEGVVTMSAVITTNSARLAMNLDTVFTISNVAVKVNNEEVKSSFSRENGLIFVQAESLWKVNDQVQITTHYKGKPLAAPLNKLSWSDGFFWDKTTNDEHWITNVTVLNGADIWWPCKDHPSDEPDSADLFFTVPNPLIVASNGYLKKVTPLSADRTKYHWHVSTPINNYNITINAAPYKIIDTTIRSITGEIYPIYFYVLPENYENGKILFPQFAQHLNFFEKMLGPYPFRKDKYGVAETSYYGMENQSIIAYGNNYTNNKWGFDHLHYHELAHEWFANMVTCKNWKDWWIHEGLATYMESLYVEYLHGKEAYHEYANGYLERMTNEKPVSPTGTPSCREQYIGDVYSKGAAIIHNARYLVGDKVFFKALRRLAYPEKSMETKTDGSQCRLSSTEEYIQIFEEEYLHDLNWYFLTVLRDADLPKLFVTEKKHKVWLNWSTDFDDHYVMPVEVDINGELQKIKMKKGKGKFKVKDGDTYSLDPNNWLLKKVFRR